MKSVSYIAQSPRLLDELREVLGYKHYSLRTEEPFLYWVKFLFADMGALVSCFTRVTCGDRGAAVFIYADQLKVAAGGAASPLDSLLPVQ